MPQYFEDIAQNWAESNTIKPFHTSPSQLAKFEQCPRAWWFESIRKLKPPQTEAQVLGEAIHKELEDYTAHQDLTVLSARAQALAKYVDLTSIDQVEVKGALPLVMDGGIAQINMRIDLICKFPQYVLVGDYKTTSNLKWSLTEETIKRDLQCTCYLEWARRNYDHDDIRAQWMYVTRKGALRTIAVNRRWEQREMEVELQRIREILARMKQYAALEIPETVPCKTTGCSAYGGCPHTYCQKTNITGVTNMSFNFRRPSKTTTTSNGDRVLPPEARELSAAEKYLPAEGPEQEGGIIAKECVVGRKYRILDQGAEVFVCLGPSKNFMLFRYANNEEITKENVIRIPQDEFVTVLSEETPPEAKEEETEEDDFLADLARLRAQQEESKEEQREESKEEQKEESVKTSPTEPRSVSGKKEEVKEGKSLTSPFKRSRGRPKKEEFVKTSPTEPSASGKKEEATQIPLIEDSLLSVLKTSREEANPEENAALSEAYAEADRKEAAAKTHKQAQEEPPKKGLRLDAEGLFLYVNCVPSCPFTDFTSKVSQKFEELRSAAGGDFDSKPSTKYGGWKHELRALIRNNVPTGHCVIYSGQLGDIAVEALSDLATLVIRGI